jgi:pimeloyl-ACP methyl ester carboxylesterase
VLLIGHDWGGGVAWSAAMQQVRPIERLIVMNAPHPFCLMRGLLRPEQLLRSWYMFMFQLPWLPERLLRANRGEAIARAFVNGAVDKSRFPVEVTDVYRKNALAPGALTAMLNYYRAMPLALLDASNWRAPRIDTPTLLLWGEDDTALTKQLALDARQYVKDLTLHFLPGVSHWVQQEAPEQVNALIERWLTAPLPA